MIPLSVMMRRAREMRRLSQRQVAEAIGRGHQSSVSEWETGITPPTVASLERWADAVGFVVAITLTPVELVDEDAYPWRSRVVYKEPTFGSGPVEEEA